MSVENVVAGGLEGMQIIKEAPADQLPVDRLLLSTNGLQYTLGRVVAEALALNSGLEIALNHAGAVEEKAKEGHGILARAFRGATSSNAQAALNCAARMGAHANSEAHLIAGCDQKLVQIAEALKGVVALARELDGQLQSTTFDAEQAAAAQQQTIGWTEAYLQEVVGQ